MSPKLRRIGIFGGSFDPPHIGHLIIAELARRTLDLDIVYFVPAYRPPHKVGNHPSTARDRLRMTKLAVRGNAGLRVSDMELKRKGVSYTVDTVKSFRRRFPSAVFFLIVGSDSLKQFQSWKSPDIILSEVFLAVYRRPHSHHQTSKVLASKVFWIKGPPVDLSSTDIRRRIFQDKTIQYMVRENVLGFITRKHLYQNSIL
jgi:nicotinate-nucleotide adenylyltransferase